jgi:hypothetical protein
MYLDYARLGVLLGPDGALYAYSDDIYLLSDQARMSATMATVLTASPTIYRKVGLRFGWRPRKMELILPAYYDPESFFTCMETSGGCLTHVVPGFSSCLGVPRHASNDPTLITSALANIGVRHDSLLDLVEDVVEEDSCATLRLLQVYGVQRFGHMISDVAPYLVLDFATSRDKTATATFASIKQEPPPLDSTHSLPVDYGVSALTSLVRHECGSYLGAFFRDVCPL